MRALRACARLARVVPHVVAGLVTAARFGSYAPAQRQAAIATWAAELLRRFGVRLVVEGSVRPGAKLVVANHVSWLDIPAIHAVLPEARFVSKADVRSWPLVRHLVDAGGTLYLERASKRDALRVVHEVANALQGGDTVAVFPEGTTGTGHPLLPFHANLLQAAIAVAAPIQPVVLRWHEPSRPFAASAEYVGDTTLLASVWRIACARELAVAVTVLPAMGSAHADRRRLAAHLHQQMQSALDQALP